MLLWVVVTGLGAVFPQLLGFGMGRDMTWRAAAYGWPALTVFVIAIMTVGAAVTLSRAIAVIRGVPDGHHHSPASRPTPDTPGSAPRLLPKPSTEDPQ
jgi:hypothetical protein